jgi:excinuclease ABC subunit A
VPEARQRGYDAGRFSFNVKGGRCEACQGDGVTRVEMHFLPDLYVACDVCHGKRYNRETLEVRYKGRNIHEVLEMMVAEAHSFFSAVPPIARKLQTLTDVGLGYVRLGQSATAIPAARSISSTSRPRGSTSTTSSSCSKSCTACAMPATPWS